MTRWKGELADGKIHMTAEEYCNHKVAEDHEKRRQLLRKIGNNPILTKDVQDAVLYAVQILDNNIWLRKQCIDLLEMHRALQRTMSNDVLTRQEAQKKIIDLKARKTNEARKPF